MILTWERGDHRPSEKCGRSRFRTYEPLACKAEYSQDYAQLPGPTHAVELRKPCREVPQSAWESLQGGSRKWFPEQSADPSLKERVAVWRRGYRSRTRRMAVTGARKDSADQLHTR
jgi:hypothetical protein